MSGWILYYKENNATFLILGLGLKNLLQSFFFCPCHAVCGILVPQPGPGSEKAPSLNH